MWSDERLRLENTTPEVSSMNELRWIDEYSRHPYIMHRNWKSIMSIYFYRYPKIAFPFRKSIIKRILAKRNSKETESQT